ncbi:MAG TPA: GspMb/PilO family protein [Candidatus Acidoferrales bacterium]|nr:GspMb/PilO family protein [Candidatus Acidoferrales bacterium]
MSHKWPAWKMWTSIALALLLAADVGLGVFLWQTARQAPAQMRSQRALLATQAKLLKADVVRGEKIRGSLPLVKNDCDSFYRQSFLDATTGYSGIESDLDSIAAKAGVKTSGFKFDQKEVKGRGVAEISVTTSVEADYPSLMEFIDGLERSRNFYLLDQLSLTSATAGAIRLQVGLHTYFRT